MQPNHRIHPASLPSLHARTPRSRSCPYLVPISSSSKLHRSNNTPNSSSTVLVSIKKQHVVSRCFDAESLCFHRVPSLAQSSRKSDGRLFSRINCNRLLQKWSPFRSAVELARVVILGEHTHVDALLGEVPQHLDELVGEGVEVHVKLAVCGKSASDRMLFQWVVLTLDIILSVCLVGLVVVDHLHYLKQVILGKLRQSLSKLFHVDIAVRLVSLLLWLAACSAVRSLASWARFPELLEEVCLWVAEGLSKVSTLELRPQRFHCRHTTVWVLSYLSCWKLRSW